MRVPRRDDVAGVKIGDHPRIGGDVIGHWRGAGRGDDAATGQGVATEGFVRNGQRLGRVAGLRNLGRVDGRRRCDPIGTGIVGVSHWASDQRRGGQEGHGGREARDTTRDCSGGSHRVRRVGDRTPIFGLPRCYQSGDCYPWGQRVRKRSPISAWWLQLPRNRSHHAELADWMSKYGIRCRSTRLSESRYLRARPAHRPARRPSSTRRPNGARAAASGPGRDPGPERLPRPGA